MSLQTRRALLKQFAPQYRKVSSKRKRLLLDAFVEATGYHRRRREALRYVPALFMSANPPQDELERRGFSALKKPFEVEELRERVRGVLGEL